MKDITDVEEYKKKETVKPGAVTILLIAVNVAVFIILEILGDTEDPEFMLLHGAMYPPSVTESGEYWRLFTAAFLHFGFEHLLNNMVILACAGHFLEDALGHGAYLVLYLISAVASNFISYEQMCRSGDYAVSAGASGAIFAVIGGLLWIVIRHKGNYESLTTRGMLFMIALCLFYGISTAGVDNWSHVGGLVSGFVLCVILYRVKPKKIDLDMENQYT
jgi:rhomboid protease GluP